MYSIFHRGRTMSSCRTVYPGAFERLPGCSTIQVGCVSRVHYINESSVFLDAVEIASPPPRTIASFSASARSRRRCHSGREQRAAPSRRRCDRRIGDGKASARVKSIPRPFTTDFLGKLVSPDVGTEGGNLTSIADGMSCPSRCDGKMPLDFTNPFGLIFRSRRAQIGNGLWEVQGFFGLLRALGLLACPRLCR
jgi:hypothetical protein